MPFTYDPEIASVLAALAARAPQRPAPGDIDALRTLTDAGLDVLFAGLPDVADMEMAEYTAAGEDGGEVPLRWFAKAGAAGGAAVVYAHGGGMICGSAPQYDRLLRFLADRTGVSFLSVDYRLPPEHRDTGLARDVLAGLRWLHGKAGSLGVDPGRIAVMGDSGGGGVAAAAAIMARDAGIALARQILIYPMLDDRNVVPDPWLAPVALWNYDFNLTAWSTVLGDRMGGDDVSPYLSPARLDDFAGLPPAYIEVGELDIFRDESIAYAQRLLAAGISCELHVHPGAPHSFENMNFASDISKRAFAERVRVLRQL